MSQPPAHHNVTFPSAAGTAHGYLAAPAAGSGPGVIVVHEWWGLTGHIADVADRLAAEGFTALAPDLFDGTIVQDAAEAERMMVQLPNERAVQLLSGAADRLLSRPEVTTGGGPDGQSAVGVVGFGMGGGLVFVLAARDPRVRAATPFYGMVHDGLPDFSILRAQVSGHYGEHDTIVPPESLDVLATRIRRQSGIQPVFHLYPAGHGFFDDTRPETYDPDSARLAWRRTVDFLRVRFA